MKRLLPAAVAVVVLAAVATGFWLGTRSGSIPATMPSSAPAIGSCWNVLPDAVSGTLPWPGHAVGCAGTHTAEIYYRAQADHSLIKQYRAAKGQSARAAAVVMDAEARAGCTGHASAYLGGAWRGAQLTIVPDFIGPVRNGFYACVVAQVDGPGGNRVLARTAPLAGALATTAALGIDCFSGVGSAALFVMCTKNHNGEFVGLYTVTPLSAPFNGPELMQAVTAGCQRLLNSFLGLPSGAPNRPDLQSSYVGPTTSATWLGSDQSYACYATASVTMRGSLKNLGTRPLPH